MPDGGNPGSVHQSGPALADTPGLPLGIGDVATAWLVRSNGGSGNMIVYATCIPA